MKIIKLYTGEDNKSYFTEIDSGPATKQHLGLYSEKIKAANIIFRDFEKNMIFDLHNAPQPQYIVYLEGEIEVEASGGETRIFKPGDILFATDLTGKGHITRTLTDGRSIVITTRD